MFCRQNNGQLLSSFLNSNMALQGQLFPNLNLKTRVLFTRPWFSGLGGIRTPNVGSVYFNNIPFAKIK
jgi:hypothetical protein